MTEGQRELLKWLRNCINDARDKLEIADDEIVEILETVTNEV